MGTWHPDMIQYTPPSLRTCQVCGYVGTIRDVHTQVTETATSSRFICCTCLGHELGSCWRKDRFPKSGG